MDKDILLLTPAYFIYLMGILYSKRESNVYWDAGQWDNGSVVMKVLS